MPTSPRASRPRSTTSKPTTTSGPSWSPGRGPVFSAGADLKAVAAGRGLELMTKRGGFGGITQRAFPKPLIAAVNGPALAGGFEIVLSCDLVVAADDARFGLPEVKRGLFASAGGLVRLPKRVPLALATEVAITGEPIDAGRARCARAREPGGAEREGRGRSAGAGGAHRRERAGRSARLLAHGPRGGRPVRGRRLAAQQRGRSRGRLDQGRDRGRHRLRREARRTGRGA